MLRTDLSQDNAIKEISSQEAWHLLKEDSQAVLIDVRSVPEWTFTGVPDLSELNKDLVCVAWRIYPTMEINKDFMAQLESGIGKDYERPLLFVCRTGGRSYDAAVEANKAGYSICYNVVDGFEGEVDSRGHRGTVSGWKKENLPWVQG